MPEQAAPQRAASIQSILDRLRARAAETLPRQWVEGFLYDDTKLKDRRPLSRTDLDKVSTRGEERW